MTTTAPAPTTRWFVFRNRGGQLRATLHTSRARADAHKRRLHDNGAVAPVTVAAPTLTAAKHKARAAWENRITIAQAADPQVTVPAP